MSKKIFKGTINGKEFTSEVEFNKHLAEVLADNGDNLSVSKSTEIVEDEQVEEKNENPAEADEDKYIFDVSMLELKDDKTYWGMESDIESEVRKADNRDEIESTLKSLAEGMEKANDELSDEIDDLNKKIAEIKEEIEAKQHQILVNSAKTVSYEGLLNRTRRLESPSVSRVHFPDMFDFLLYEFFGLL